MNLSTSINNVSRALKWNRFWTQVCSTGGRIAKIHCK